MKVLLNKSFIKYPKFKHNLWLRPENKPQITYLTVSDGTYEVPSEEAQNFLKIRTYCTGFNSHEEISKRLNLPVNTVEATLAPYHEANITHAPIKEDDLISSDEIAHTFLTMAKLFGDQLAETNITLEILSGKLKKEVVLGWLFETYHYIKFFPETLEVASNHASGKLKEIIAKYAKEEKGHEIFIARSLEMAGFSKDEIQHSTPLVSTKTIKLLLEDLFAFEPATVFIVAGIIEALEYQDATKQKFAKAMKKFYSFNPSIWDPLFEHIKIDDSLGHQKLLEKHIEYIKKIDKTKLNAIADKIHDIKHAFDLQALEIKSHYSNAGSYLQRQKVLFSSIL